MATAVNSDELSALLPWATLRQKALIESIAKHGTLTKGAEAIGMDQANASKALALLKAKAAKDGNMASLASPQPEDLPPADLPFAERLEVMKRRNELRIAHARAQNWQPVTIPLDGPYGICWFGDPHLDDPYCDLASVERHAAICRETPGLFGANGGDSVNNWVGRLERLYAEQSVTASEAWELVDWFMNGLGVRWLVWLLGNHDVWNHGKPIFEKSNANAVLMRDWDARLSLLSPDGSECKVWARHDFKGSSIYNELHGLKRASMLGGKADIYAAFHRHTWGTAAGETEDGQRFCLVRAKGYKDVDHYALVNGFAEQIYGQSVVTVITPNRHGSPLIRAFEDVEEGAEFLTYKRRKLAA